jgi:hypothetical protein
LLLPGHVRRLLLSTVSLLHLLLHLLHLEELLLHLGHHLIVRWRSGVVTTIVELGHHSHHLHEIVLLTIHVGVFLPITFTLTHLFFSGHLLLHFLDLVLLDHEADLIVGDL